MRKICVQCGQKDCGFANRGMEDDCEKVQLYEQGYDDAVDKACEWLKSEYENIGIRYIRGCSSSDEVENFKKAMEDESR